MRPTQICDDRIQAVTPPANAKIHINTGNFPIKKPMAPYKKQSAKKPTIKIIIVSILLSFK